MRGIRRLESLGHLGILFGRRVCGVPKVVERDIVLPGHRDFELAHDIADRIESVLVRARQFLVLDLSLIHIYFLMTTNNV